MQSKPERVIDPVCGMSVRVAEAEAADLTQEHEGRIYAFCRPGCLSAFRGDPSTFAAAMESSDPTVPTPSTLLPEIDEGMRRWYENCSCCLSDAYPDIKAQLDAERAAGSQPPAAAGICEVAERDPATEPVSLQA